MMQTDVKSYHTPTGTPGLAFADRTRLRGLVVANTTAGANTVMALSNISLSGTYNIPGTTTVTVTTTNPHGLATGARVFLTFTSGTGVSNAVVATVTGATTFTGTVASATTSGNVSVYYQILLEADITNTVPYCITIPGEGIVADDGIYLGVPATCSATAFYG
jgi:hypothetical protein